jgi:2-polyprenyl-3-methyl-5-hydroxy-6-metoxy-1,4-benzoquinol methylase
MKNCEEIKECIACGSNNLMPLLDLGMQPLANSFLKSDNELEPYFPLATNYCKSCYHVQLTHKVDPDLLFKNYLYVSGTAKTQLEYFDWFANLVCENGASVSSVLDIGCNDGSQLDSFARLGVKTYGVDPAENLYEVSSKKHTVHCGYFDESFPNGKFDVVICQNAFAHNYDQLSFLRNMKRVVADHGLIYVTTSQADMIFNTEFDTIYHEHLSFYNIKSMDALCRRAGLNLIEVLKHPIHGTSYIFVISKHHARNAYLDLAIKSEAHMGLYDDESYTFYVEECKEIIEGFADEVSRHKAEGKILVGYGAPAKGNTLLNASNVFLNFIIDDNPLKQGLYTPGMRIPIFSSEKLKDYENIDNLVFVPLAWNFFDEIKAKIQKIRPNKKDSFLKYFPYVYTESDSE